MSPIARPKIALVYIDSGGGHRAAANALSQVIREQNRPWDIQLVSIQDMLDSIDFIRQYTGIKFQDVYNILLRKGWTLGSAQMIPLMHLVIRMSHGAQVQVLDQQWSRIRPDMVVSLIPHYNRAMKQALDRACPGTPYVTVLTDIADYPPHFWIERQEQYVVTGSERATAQARRLGIPEPRILKASGMILNPRFYEPSQVDRRAERIRLGLAPDRPTGLVLFGGEGSMEIVKIARALNQPGSPVQLILICGKHRRAAEALRAMGRHIPMFVEGFTCEVPKYMELADFFIGKPGPGSISEAMAKGLPVIVERNAWTMAHERYNADWVEQQQVGMAIGGPWEVRRAVERLLQPDQYPQYRERVLAVHNRAVYEIPEMLEGILVSRGIVETTSPRERSQRSPGQSIPDTVHSA